MSQEEVQKHAGSVLDSLAEETLVELEGEEKEAEENSSDSPNYDIKGVQIVAIDEVIQPLIGTVVGVDVTGEYPWKRVSKKNLLTNIQENEESPFASLKNAIEAYPDEDILIGYILDESNDSDQFYICLTPNAREHCELESERFLQKQREFLEHSVLKEVLPWVSLGSEKEVDESIPKNNRPLIRIQVKSIYPVSNQPDRFRCRNSDDARDGYIELVPYRTKFNNIIKKRVDVEVQASPAKRTSSAQTVPRFPRNIWTQCQLEEDAREAARDRASEALGEMPVNEIDRPKYELALKKLEKERETAQKKLEAFINISFPIVDRIVHFNSTVDIYNLDYPKLITNSDKSQSVKMDIEEILVFTDHRAIHKLVTSASWNAYYNKNVAVSYTDTGPCVITFPKDAKDDVRRAVFGENPVLIWSVADTLSPQLVLESNREVNILSFCPFNENILIGGTSSGQLIIWDLTGKLDTEEDIEILSEYQENNRITIKSQMTWMKHIHDKSVVRTTASSDLFFSHVAPISDIAWLSSHYEFDTSGKLRRLTNEDNKSMQILSISEDGCILIWDLDPSKYLTNDEDDGVKRVSHLIWEKSPFKSFDGTLKPIFKIIVGELGSTKSNSLGSMSMEFPWVYRIYKKVDLQTPIKLYEEVPEDVQDENISPIVSVTTINGEYIRITWNAIETNLDTIGTSNATFLSRAIKHSGPLYCCIRNPFFNDIVATVGGVSFALWSGEKQLEPFLWKQMNCYITNAVWSNTVPSQLFIITEMGKIDVWDFLERSDWPILSQIVGGSFLTGAYIHSISHTQNTVGLANASGFFRLFIMPPFLTESSPDDLELSKKYFEREQFIKYFYREWSKRWDEKNLDILAKIQEEEVSRLQRMQEKRKSDIKREEEKQQYEIELLGTKKSVICSGKEQWTKIQWDGIELAIQERKRLKTKYLLFLEKPLRDIEDQKRAKHRKIMSAIKKRNSAFEESVAILFPEAVSEPCKVDFQTPEKKVEEIRNKILTEYNAIVKDSKKIIKDQPYEEEFNWQNILWSTKIQRRYLDDSATAMKRLKLKVERQIENEMKKPVPKVSEAKESGETSGQSLAVAFADDVEIAG